MKKSRFTEAQIIGFLRQAEAGIPIKEVCRGGGFSDATFYKWRAKFGGMEASEAQRLRELEAENAKLKKLLAEAHLDMYALKSVLGVKRCIDPVKSCTGVIVEGKTMSTLMEDDIKRWTAKRKTALVLDIIQGKTTVAEASRAYDLTPSEVEALVEEGKRGMENALRSKPLEVKEQYERQVRELQEAYGEAMLELRARKKLASLLGNEDEK